MAKMFDQPIDRAFVCVIGLLTAPDSLRFLPPKLKQACDRLLWPCCFYRLDRREALGLRVWRIVILSVAAEVPSSIKRGGANKPKEAWAIFRREVDPQTDQDPVSQQPETILKRVVLPS